MIYQIEIYESTSKIDVLGIDSAHAKPVEIIITFDGTCSSWLANVFHFVIFTKNVTVLKKVFVIFNDECRILAELAKKRVKFSLKIYISVLYLGHQNLGNVQHFDSSHLIVRDHFI